MYITHITQCVPPVIQYCCGNGICLVVENMELKETRERHRRESDFHKFDLEEKEIFIVSRLYWKFAKIYIAKEKVSPIHQSPLSTLLFSSNVMVVVLSMIELLLRYVNFRKFTVEVYR